LQIGILQFVVYYFILLPKVTKLQLFETNYAKHCSEAVCILLLHAASTVTAVACLGPADTWE